VAGRMPWMMQPSIVLWRVAFKVYLIKPQVPSQGVAAFLPTAIGHPSQKPLRTRPCSDDSLNQNFNGACARWLCELGHLTDHAPLWGNCRLNRQTGIPD